MKIAGVLLNVFSLTLKRTHRSHLVTVSNLLTYETAINRSEPQSSLLTGESRQALVKSSVF